MQFLLPVHFAYNCCLGGADWITVLLKSLKLFAAGVFRHWWFYVLVGPAALAGFAGLYLPDFRFSLTPLATLIWFMAAILVAAFRTYHDLRLSIPVSKYDPEIGKKLSDLYYKLKPMTPLEMVLLISEIEELLAENIPTEQFLFGSYCRKVLPEDDQLSTLSPERIDAIKVKLRKIIARYEQLQR